MLTGQSGGLEQHPELLDKLEGMILAKHGIKRGGMVAATNGAAHPDESDPPARPSAEDKATKGRPAGKPAN